LLSATVFLTLVVR